MTGEPDLLIYAVVGEIPRRAFALRMLQPGYFSPACLVLPSNPPR